MAPYYYAADKREVRSTSSPAPHCSGCAAAARVRLWQQRLRDLIDEIDDKLRTHPGLGDILPEQMLGKQLDLIEAVMEILFDAGFSDRNVLAAYATIHTYLFGRSRVNPRDRSAPADVLLPEAVARATKYMPDLRGKYSYDFGMEVLVAGLEAQLALQARPGLA